MTNFIVIEKDSLNKSTVNATQITLTEASIVHTKMSRDDVDEFIRDGNNLVLKLKNGEVVVIENFFITYDDVASDLVFEEDGCVLYWFDGVSGFKGISGLEALLPAAESSQLVGLLPWLVGAAVVGGAAAIIDHNDKDEEPKDTTAPTAPTVEINDGGDGVINPTDLVNGKVTVTVKPTEPVVEGDKITITHPDGSIEEIEVTASSKDDINNNGITVEVTPAAEGKDTVVTATVTDKAGNTSPEGSDNSTVDLVVPGDVDGDGEKDLTGAPVVEIQDGGDDVINPSDVDENGKVDAKVTFPKDAGYSVGDTVVIKDQDGTELVNRPLTAEDLENGITVKVTPAAEGEDTVVTAVVTDPQGNESPEGSDNSTVDLVVPGDVDGDGEKDLTGAPVVEIQDGGDDVINPSDVDENGKVDAKVTFPKDAGYSVGDTVVIKDQDGTELVNRPLTAEDLENGITVKVTPAAEGEDTVVTAVVTDPQGNESPEGSDNSTVDLVDGSITVDIDDNDSTQITGTTTDVPPNSTVTLTIKTSIDDNGETREFTTTVETDNDGNYSYTLTPEQGNATEVVAQVTDRNGVQREDTDQSDAVIKTDPTTEVDNGDNTVIGAAGDDLLAGDTGGLKTNFVSGQDYNISVVLDLSGSMNFGLTTNTNAASGELSRLDIAKAGLKAFIQQMVEHDGTIILQLASFSSGTYAGNKHNMSWTVTQDNLQAIFTYIDGLTAAGGTNPNDGWDKAVDWLEGSTTGMESNSVAADATYENQTYYITDGEPNRYGSTNTGLTATDWAKYDADFAKLADLSKVFAVGVSSAITQSTIERFDNTDINGNKIDNWSSSNHGTANSFTSAEKLIAYLIGGSENFEPADVGNDIVKGGAGDDILFGDAMNTDWITGLDPLQYPKYSGYSKLIAHLKADVTGGVEPTQQQIYDFVKDNYQKFVTADATDIATKGGNDTIYGGSGNDIIIAGAGDDRIYGGSGNDIISTGRGDDTIVYDLLNTADATGGNGTDTWVDYEANDKIEFGADFFEGLLSVDQSDIANYIKVEDDGNGNAVLKIDRDGAADATGGTTHDWADLLIIEGKTALELQDLINNQIIIG
ncbi:cell-surface adhesin [Acinetobacter baumannii]|uniref:BapA/Bap/LapF family prefix-like domain-containing protein n=2 Tax=Gammaproteobacteria TaxID=1236 RepID=UPI000DE6D786|nr:BapA prefix-like domain-containing protein [Acinetobacter baumannii]SSO60570.1 cell-surface adhesin [Acinetobacter baumannii]